VISPLLALWTNVSRFMIPATLTCDAYEVYRRDLHFFYYGVWTKMGRYPVAFIRA
jgi:hypothetical protein